MTGAKQGPKAVRVMQELESNGISCGYLHGPSNWVNPYTEIYALDNDCFANSKQQDWWEKEGEYKWLKMLDRVTYAPLFAVLPDVVADWPRTVERAWKYIPELRDRSIPVAIALQDGCSLDAALMLSPDWFFVGGSTKWKWLNVERIVKYGNGCLGIRTHIGRVNGERKIRECVRIGADSCDGTGLARFSDEMLPRTIAAFRPRVQLSLDV